MSILFNAFQLTILYSFRWTSSLFLFSMSFYVTWVGYAIAYWLIMHIHGDFAHCKLENDGVTVTCEDNWTPCILAVHDFSSAFLFSLETQHTIGYGSRQSTTECIDLIIICSTQSVLGCLIQAFMVGVVFAKLSVPNKRLVCLHDEYFYIRCYISKRQTARSNLVHIQG